MVIALDEGAQNTTTSTTAHLLPCHVHTTGNVQAKTFFQPWPSPQDPSRQVCAFRGRELTAHSISLPEEYTGTCFHCLPIRRIWLIFFRFSIHGYRAHDRRGRRILSAASAMARNIYLSHYPALDARPCKHSHHEDYYSLRPRSH